MDFPERLAARYPRIHPRKRPAFRGHDVSRAGRAARLFSEVRHPPQSGWLDEWDRLKGGHLLSLGVALKRAFVNGLELFVCSIRGFLLADVLADLLQFKADRGDSVTAVPRDVRP